MEGTALDEMNLQRKSLGEQQNTINNGDETEEDNLVSNELFYLNPIALIGHDGG